MAQRWRRSVLDATSKQYSGCSRRRERVVHSLKVIGAHLSSAAIAVQTFQTPVGSLLARVEEFRGPFTRSGVRVNWLVTRGGKRYALRRTFRTSYASQGPKGCPRRKGAVPWRLLEAVMAVCGKSKALIKSPKLSIFSLPESP